MSVRSRRLLDHPTADPDEWMPYCVYLIVCLVDGKGYVGAAKSPVQYVDLSIFARWKEHQTDAFNPNDRNWGRHFMAAIREHGADAFVVKILEWSETWKTALEREIYWIAEFDTFHGVDVGYNMTEGGEGTSGRTREWMGEEELHKRRLAGRAMVERPGFLTACSAASLASWSTPEQVERRRAAMKEARNRPDVKAAHEATMSETARKIARAQKENWSRPETREKQARVNALPEVHEKKSSSAKASWTVDGVREKRSASMRAGRARVRAARRLQLEEDEQ